MSASACAALVCRLARSAAAFWEARGAALHDVAYSTKALMVEGAVRIVVASAVLEPELFTPTACEVLYELLEDAGQ